MPARRAGSPRPSRSKSRTKGISIADNGPGIAPETVSDILDYSARVSSREAYVSPTRGAQGNALKTILGTPFALDGEHGETIIESRGAAHRIGFSIDRIRQEPQIARTFESSLVKNGTRITVLWPDSASSILDGARVDFLQIAADYTWINPHLTLTVEWNRTGEERRQTFAGSNPSWCKRRPSDPTSPRKVSRIDPRISTARGREVQGQGQGLEKGSVDGGVNRRQTTKLDS